MGFRTRALCIFDRAKQRIYENNEDVSSNFLRSSSIAFKTLTQTTVVSRVGSSQLVQIVAKRMLWKMKFNLFLRTVFGSSASWSSRGDKERFTLNGHRTRIVVTEFETVKCTKLHRYTHVHGDLQVIVERSNSRTDYETWTSGRVLTVTSRRTDAGRRFSDRTRFSVIVSAIHYN